jgi:Domain of unknown function (DUF5916)
MLHAVIAAGWLAALAPAPGQPHASDPPIYRGRSNELAVSAPRLAADADVDGLLDEPVWREAAILTGFSQYRPVDGLPAEDSTEVLVWYSEHAIWFGIRAFEPHGIVNATLADRDKIDGDDNVRILLDTFNDRRRALFFASNALGVQADGVWTEGLATKRTDGMPIDLSPDFVYESKGRITPDGYEIEMKIPFKSLRYQSDPVQTWSINVIRQVQHSGYQQTWTPALRGQTSFLAQSGTLEQLSQMRRGLVLDVNPVITAKVDGAPDASNNWRYDGERPEIGANVRWGVTANLTMNGTVNPDFSQVESDVSQLTFDPRSALFFPEKRPFFLEASENFEVPNQLIYTRRVASPVAAAKFTGKVSDTEIGLLTAVDDNPSTSADHPVFNIVRLRRDVGAGSTLGIAYTDRIQGAAYNRVAAADTRILIGGVYSVSAQLGASFTGDGTTSNAWRPIFEVAANRRGRRFGYSAIVEGTHRDFRALSGFISRSDIAHANVRPSYTWYGSPGATIESFTTSVLLDGNWTYQRFMNGTEPDDQKLHFVGSFTFRGGWSLSTTAVFESFKYPPTLYSRYFIDTGTDTIPYTGVDRIGNYDAIISVGTPQFRTFSADAFVATGRDENFFEWSKAWVFLSTLNLNWRPTEQLRVSGRYVIQSYNRVSDRSNVGLRQIPRVKLEYQLSRPIFIRLVGEYDADRQDDLRDDSRTDRPILLCDAGPVNCSPAAAYRRGSFRGDWLFSYQPTPGTVLFVGYGSSLGSDQGYGLGDLRRTSDGFFVKLSYLLRA